MLRPRVIPVLLIRGNALVKSRGFARHQYLGDPLNAVKLFNGFRADEILVLDIEASGLKRSISKALVEEIGGETSMPFSVGGGLKTLQQIGEVIKAGAERVVIGSAAIENPDLVRQAAESFGSSAIAVCIDIKRKFWKGNTVFSRSATVACQQTPVDFARRMAELGAGEVIVQSVDRDGTMDGYDLDLTRSISHAVTVPVVALGGAGNLSHLRDAHQTGGASGVAAGSMFVYQGKQRGVLLNYPERTELRRWFKT